MDITVTELELTKFTAELEPGEITLPFANATCDSNEVALWLERNETKSWGNLRIPISLFPEFVAFVADVNSQIESTIPE